MYSLQEIITTFETVCYTVSNAITNVKVRDQAHVLKKKRGQSPRPSLSDAYVHIG